jgi:hypothetical protein
MAIGWRGVQFPENIRSCHQNPLCRLDEYISYVPSPRRFVIDIGRLTLSSWAEDS